MKMTKTAIGVLIMGAALLAWSVHSMRGTALIDAIGAAIGAYMMGLVMGGRLVGWALQLR